ncbi:MAG: siderophore-interacting protein [Pseudomonadota bacterium]
MIEHARFPSVANARVSGIAFEAMRSIVLAQAAEHDLPILRDDDKELMVETVYGVYAFRPLATRFELSVLAPNEQSLFILKDAFVHQLSTFAPDSASKLRWSDAATVGAPPPNFQVTTVQSIEPVGGTFLRVKVAVPDLTKFNDTSIHFQLVLPPAGAKTIIWPHIGENGATVWPKGELALHRPVYTARHILLEEGQLDLDVFLHDGGRVTAWAREARAGDLLALMGPSGGGVPDARRFLLFADETAFPAVARIVETIPASATGEIVLSAVEGERCSYPISPPPGMKLTWQSRGSKTSLGELAIEMSERWDDHFLWFAAEKSEAVRVRRAYKAEPRPDNSSYIAAYWTRSLVP